MVWRITRRADSRDARLTKPLLKGIQLALDLYQETPARRKVWNQRMAEMNYRTRKLFRRIINQRQRRAALFRRRGRLPSWARPLIVRFGGHLVDLLSDARSGNFEERHITQVR